MCPAIISWHLAVQAARSNFTLGFLPLKQVSEPFWELLIVILQAAMNGSVER